MKNKVDLNYNTMLKILQLNKKNHKIFRKYYLECLENKMSLNDLHSKINTLYWNQN